MQQPEEVDVQAEHHGERGKEGDADAQGPLGQAAEDERIEDVRQVFPLQRPRGAVEGVGLGPAADVHGVGQGKHGEAPEHHQQHHVPRGLVDQRELGTAAEVEQHGAEEGAQQHHGVQTDETAFEEVPRGHAVPAVVVGIADNKARQHEEEVDGKVAVIDGLTGASAVVGLKEVIGHDEHGAHAAKAVEYRVAGLRGEIDVVAFVHRLVV